MIQPNNDELVQLATAVKMFPKAFTWIHAWHKQEMERLPLAINSPTLAMGRCQVLQEIVKKLNDAPDLVGKH